MALTDNLVAYWKLDESSGSRSDSVGSNTLTDVNTVASATGLISNAADFERSNGEYLSIADNADLSTGNVDFTIALWARLESKPVDGDGNMALLSKWDFSISQREYTIQYVAASDRFRFAVTSDGTNSTIGEVLANNLGSPSINTWYYIVVWHDSVNDTINIQVNNGTVNSASRTTGVLNGTASFVLGALSNADIPYDGLLDEVGVWKRVLTSDERTSLYNSGAGQTYPFTPPTNEGTGSVSSYPVSSGIGFHDNVTAGALASGLVAYWLLDEVSGNRADSIGANHLIDVNTVTSTAGISNLSARFENTNQEALVVADNADLSMGDVPFTISFWMRMASKPTTGAFMAPVAKWNYVNQAEYSILYAGSTDRVAFAASVDGTDAGITYAEATAFGALSLDTWYHIVADHDPDTNTIGIQVNNSERYSLPHASGVYSGPTSFSIGGLYEVNDLYFDGDVDEVGIWKRLLTTNERRTLYNGGSGLAYPFTTPPHNGTGSVSSTVSVSGAGERVIQTYLGTGSAQSHVTVAGIGERVIQTVNGIGSVTSVVSVSGTGEQTILTTVSGIGSVTSRTSVRGRALHVINLDMPPSTRLLAVSANVRLVSVLADSRTVTA